MSWRDRLRRPSWRGIPFDVQGSDFEGGRRLAVHEYPQQDKPYAEDMGRGTRRIVLAGLVVGDDYYSTRDLLIEACEEPGPGVLVHPHYGELTVSCERYRVTEDNSTGRMAVIEFTFVESGEAAFPVSYLNPAATVEAGADAAAAAAGADFIDRFLTEGPAWMLAQAAADLTAAVDAIRDRILGPLADAVEELEDITRQLDVIGDTAATLVRTPGDLVSSLQAVMDAIEAVGDAALDVFTGLTEDAGAAAEDPVGSTDNAEIVAGNKTALDRLIRIQALAGASVVVAAKVLTSYDEAIDLRDLLADRMAAEGEASESADVVAALGDLRGDVVDDLTTRATSLARIRTLTPTAVLPAAVLAYDLYADASRGDEVVTRNALPHPGLVPARALQVLSR